MKFRVNQSVASPLEVTIRDQYGSLVDLVSYTSASAEVVNPYGVTTVVVATKQKNKVIAYLPELDVAGEWELYIGLWKSDKVDYSQKIGFEVV